MREQAIPTHLTEIRVSTRAGYVTFEDVRRARDRPKAVGAKVSSLTLLAELGRGNNGTIRKHYVTLRVEAAPAASVDTNSQRRRRDAAAKLYRGVYDTPRAPARLPIVERTGALSMFHQWQSVQEWQPDAAGDLAWMVSRGCRVPVSTDDIEIIRGYLRKVGAKEQEAVDEPCEHCQEGAR